MPARLNGAVTLQRILSARCAFDNEPRVWAGEPDSGTMIVCSLTQANPTGENNANYSL